MWRGGWRRACFPEVLLFGFGGLALVATCFHFGGMEDVFELGIVAYMLVLYRFFRHTRLPVRWLQRIAFFTLAVFCLYASAEAVLDRRAVYDVYTGSSLGFMSRRFFFRFAHPNLLGSYYALPVICVLVANAGRVGTWSVRRWALAALGMGMLCAPLALTVSRHMLLTGALLAGFAVAEWRVSPKLSVPVWIAVLGGIFAGFYLMILFPFFPLRDSFPFFNHETWGMYTIHQKIYLDIVFRDPRAFLAGVGKTGVRELYPLLADWESAYRILAQYKQEFLTESFVTYMDAHNEYLNLATVFGVPAMLACYGFWGGLARQAGWRRAAAPLLFYIFALFLVSLWDDIMSKRWIWIGLAILVRETLGDGPAPCAAPDASARDEGGGGVPAPDTPPARRGKQETIESTHDEAR